MTFFFFDGTFIGFSRISWYRIRLFEHFQTNKLRRKCLCGFVNNYFIRTPFMAQFQIRWIEVCLSNDVKDSYFQPKKKHLRIFMKNVRRKLSLFFTSIVCSSFSTHTPLFHVFLVCVCGKSIHFSVDHRALNI